MRIRLRCDAGPGSASDGPARDGGEENRGERQSQHVRDKIRAPACAHETPASLVYAASRGETVVDLAVYFVREAPDLPSTSSAYWLAFAGSRLSCQDLLLVRFNAALLGG